MNKQLQEIINRLESRSELQALTPKRVWNPELDSKIASLELTKQVADNAVISMIADMLKQQAQLDSLQPSPIVNRLKQFRDQQSWNCDDFVDLIKL